MTDNLPALNADDLALMEEGSRTGVEQFNMRQRIVPYLRLVQAGTPYGKRSHPEYVEGCVEGDIIDTLMKKPMKSATVIPCKYEDHWTEWEAKTDDSPGRLVKQWFTDSSKYDACPSNMGPGMPRITAEGNVINQTPTYYCLLVDEGGAGRPVVLALQSTQAKKSRHWNGLIDSLTYNGPSGPFTAPIYARSYILTTVPEKSRNRPEPYMGWVIREGALTLSLPSGRFLWKQAQAVRTAVEAGEMRSDQQAPMREIDAEVTTRPVSTNGNTPPPSDDDIPF
jgi:hypothetical protein